MKTLDYPSKLFDLMQGSAGPCFFNRDRDWEYFKSGPINETGTGNSISRVSLLGPGSGLIFSQSRSKNRDGTIHSPGIH